LIAISPVSELEKNAERRMRKRRLANSHSFGISLNADIHAKDP